MKKVLHYHSLQLLLGAVVFAVLLGIGFTTLLNSPVGHADDSDKSKLSSERLIALLVEDAEKQREIDLAMVVELVQRGDAVDRDLYLQVLADAATPPLAQQTVADLLVTQSSGIDKKVRDLLLSKETDVDAKVQIIARGEFTKADVGLLRTLFAHYEDIVAFHALKQLVRVAPDTAIELAKGVMSGEASELRLSAAIKALVRGPVQHDASLVRVLNSVLAAESASEVVKDAAFFGLSEMRDPKAIASLVRNDKLDRGLVVGAIDENAAVLLQMLKGAKTPAGVELVLDAMEILPITEIGAELAKVPSAVIRSERLQARVEVVMAHIKREGLPMNTKWTEK